MSASHQYFIKLEGVSFAHSPNLLPFLYLCPLVCFSIYLVELPLFSLVDTAQMRFASLVTSTKFHLHARFLNIYQPPAL
jgi:hypothetical protein